MGRNYCRECHLDWKTPPQNYWRWHWKYKLYNIILPIVITIITFGAHRALPVIQALEKVLLNPSVSGCLKELSIQTPQMLLKKWLFQKTAYQSSSTHQVQCHSSASQEAGYWGLRLPEPVSFPWTCGKGRLSWGPKEEGSQELAARLVVVRGTQFPIGVQAVCCLFHLFGLFVFSQLALFKAAQ